MFDPVFYCRLPSKGKFSLSFPIDCLYLTLVLGIIITQLHNQSGAEAGENKLVKKH